MYRCLGEPGERRSVFDFADEQVDAVVGYVACISAVE